MHAPHARCAHAPCCSACAQAFQEQLRDGHVDFLENGSVRLSMSLALSPAPHTQPSPNPDSDANPNREPKPKPQAPPQAQPLTRSASRCRSPTASRPSCPRRSSRPSRRWRARRSGATASCRARGGSRSRRCSTGRSSQARCTRPWSCCSPSSFWTCCSVRHTTGQRPRPMRPRAGPPRHRQIELRARPSRLGQRATSRRLVSRTGLVFHASQVLLERRSQRRDDQLDERAEQVLRQLKAGRAGGGGGPTARGAGI